MKLSENQLNQIINVFLSSTGVLKIIKKFSLCSVAVTLMSFISIAWSFVPFLSAISLRMVFPSPIFDLMPVDISHLGLSQIKWRIKGVNIWTPEKTCNKTVQSGIIYAINAVNNLWGTFLINRVLMWAMWNLPCHQPGKSYNKAKHSFPLIWKHLHGPYSSNRENSNCRYS